MPPPELKATVMGVVSENKPVGSVQPNRDGDLLGDDLTSAGPATGANGAAAAVAQSNKDLLAEIFGSSDLTSSAPAAQQAPRTTAQDILSLFDSSPAVPAAASVPSTSAALPPQPAAAAPPQPAQPRLVSYPAYDKNGLRISLTPQAKQPGVVDIQVRFQVTGAPASDINFQAAVPKSQQLQIWPISNPAVQPGTTETLNMRVTAPAGANVRLRIRLSFAVGGQPFQDQVDFAGFPPGITNGGS
ncbi:hypothetical protein QCA50_010464 [Cerrena zonata]|uniref:GAE domain-containing protein n=1 Tax=Cerrena zonata TaxID=2478898 RepID=A0AAW0G7I7_9APHY